jgi:amidase
MHATEFADLDATAQAALISAGEVSPQELVRASIARIEALNPSLNAVIHPRFERALDESLASLPDGPFRGVPFLVKDLMCMTAGDPYHAGNRLLKHMDYRAPCDTYLAARYRNAGFLFVGRTNTPEFGLVTTTEPIAYGPTHNPWDLARSPGGSSGGSAAAVAVGMVGAAHANDAGGSIRIPAAHCGLFGLKPSRGRLSQGPLRGEPWLGAAVEHVVTRSVRDSAAILDATAGAHPGDPYAVARPARSYAAECRKPPSPLRIGVLAHAPGNQITVDPACVEAVRNVAEMLDELGHYVEDSYPRALDEIDERRSFMKIFSAWLAHDIDELSALVGRTPAPHELELSNAMVYQKGKSLLAKDYVAAQVYLQSWARRISAWWSEGFDLLLTPTTAALPALLGSALATPDDPLAPLRASLPYMLYTAPFNITGQPAASLPLQHDPELGLPVGVQLVAAYGREDLLFQVAGQLESAHPWRLRRPFVG